jgi:hypothetical protein
MLFTSFGRLDAVEVKGVYMEGEVCMQERENYLGSPEELVLAKAWKRIVTPCFQIDSSALPRCQ